MARKARQRISYVLPLANSPGGHRLGVNSLAVDGQGILYSAGRDGVVCSWNLNVDLNETQPDAEFAPRPVPAPSTFRSQIQAHTHWVNDLALCYSNEALVSCSSDLTVKLWRPHSADNQRADTIGIHSDYVKCLAVPDVHADWVVSGGLDRKIKVWDLNTAAETLSIDVGDNGNNPKGSIYSLGMNGGILASGGPESVVRVWDPRSGDRVTKFVGHTDNIRAILVNTQGNMVLTASSDSTIKLWSLTAGRCLHTLSMHNHSVWSLCSSDPALELFHSSDKSGLVAKTDLRHATEIEDGTCVAVCQEAEGVNKVVASGDYAWTATSSSSINRWLDVDTSDSGDYKRPRITSMMSNRSRMSAVSMSPGTPSSPVSIAPTARRMIPMNALLSLSTTSAFPTNVRDPDAVTVYSMTSARQASLAGTIVDGDPGIVVPVNDLPDETIEGQHGLIKHVLLNDRRTVLTLDTAGEVTMWDILKCAPIKFFGERHLEDVAAEVNTFENIAHWCQVDTRTGRLACVLEENYCFDAEMYADEIELEQEVDFRDDQRINLGKWVLRYLFGNLIDEEIQRDEEYRKKLDGERQARDQFRRENAPPQIALPSPTFSATEVSGTRSNAGSTVTTPVAKPTGHFSLFPQTPGMSIGLATPAINLPNAPPPVPDGLSTVEENGARKSIPGTGPASTEKAGGGGDYFSANPKPTTSQGEEASGTPAAEKEKDEKDEKDSSLLGRWRSFGTKKLGRSASTDMGAKPPPIDEKAAEQRRSEEAVVEEPDPLEGTLSGVIKRLRATYDAQLLESPGQPLRSAVQPSLPNETPVLKPPKDTTIIVQEDRPDSGGVADLYRGTVGCVGKDADLLEKVAPAWLGELLLQNQIPYKDMVKVSFVLIPWRDELPVLPSESGSEGKNSRLNANRMLRAKKVMAYVQEHLSPPLMATSHVPESKDGTPVKPEDWLELLCHDQVVPSSMTLATIRSYVWKTTGDVMLHYRRKGAALEKPEEPSSSQPSSSQDSDSTSVESDVTA